LDTLTDQPNLDKESCFYRLPLSFGALKLNQIEIDAKQLSNEVIYLCFYRFFLFFK
jgi:hypothetical protein